MLWRSLVLCGLVLMFVFCVQVVELIEGKIVYIDVGYGGEDSGVVGNGFFEKDINLVVLEYVMDKLKEEGVNFVVFWFDDYFLILEERVVKVSVNQVDFFVSIYVNLGVVLVLGIEMYFQFDYEGENSWCLVLDIQFQLVLFL